MKFPVNRVSPLTGAASHRLLGYIPASVVAAENATYRSSFAEILRISPQDEFPIVSSPDGFVFAGWLPPDDFLRRVYEDVIDHSKTITQTVAYRAALLEFGAGFFDLVQRRHRATTRPLRLLDYGCGYGTLLRMLGGGDVETFGYEPSDARQNAAALGQSKIFATLSEAAEGGPFDLFICTEVLEHAAEPRGILQFIKRIASPGAVAAITVPTCELSYVETSLKGLVTAGGLSPVFNPWEHLNYFSAASLRRLLAEEGFEVINDFGRTRSLRDACAQFGDASSNAIINWIRIMKRAVQTTPTTHLFCEIHER